MKFDHQVDKLKQQKKDSVSRINARFDPQIEQASAQREALKTMLADYTRSRLSTEGSGRTVMLGTTRLSFRTAPCSLQVTGAKTWKEIEPELKEALRGTPYERQKIEIDRRKIIADRDNTDLRAILDHFGLEIKQEEEFYVE
jgi:phage host-nuclease inhibitor protein Gam